jgi:hypothetical protein
MSECDSAGAQHAQTGYRSFVAERRHADVTFRDAEHATNSAAGEFRRVRGGDFGYMHRCDVETHNGVPQLTTYDVDIVSDLVEFDITDSADAAEVRNLTGEYLDAIEEASGVRGEIFRPLEFGLFKML